MRELSPAEKDRLEDDFALRVYDTILQELAAHEWRSVDRSRTRFRVYDLPIFGFTKRAPRGTTVCCEIRRTESSLLDLDIVFGDTGPLLHAGPPPSVIPERWELEYRLWEPYFLDYESTTSFLDECRRFLRDWLEGRLTLVTTYAGSRAYRWRLMRGDEVLGKRRFHIFPYFAKRRTVTQHT